MNPMDSNKKNRVSASELARQERARKFRQSRFYRSCVANSSNRIWLFNVASMHRIKKLGLDMFDENGQLLVRSHISLRRSQMSGDIFLTELIEYWLEQDAPYAYRFGFQGQEKDDEIKGNGNSVAFEYRIHDPRIGRFLSVDPLEKDFPWYTPYQFAGNTPIQSIDLEGLEDIYYLQSMVNRQGQLIIDLIDNTEIGGEFMGRFRDPEVNIGYDMYLQARQLAGSAGGELTVSISADATFYKNGEHKPYLKYLLSTMKEGEGAEDYGFFVGLFGQEFMDNATEMVEQTIANERGLVLVEVDGNPEGEGFDASNKTALQVEGEIVGHEIGAHVDNVIQGIESSASQDHKEWNGVSGVATLIAPGSKGDRFNKQLKNEVDNLDTGTGSQKK